MDPCCVTLGRRGQGQTFDAPSDTHLGHRQHLYSRTNVLRPTWCASRSAPRSRSAHRPRPTCRNRRGARSIERPGHWGDSEGVEPVDCGVTDHRVAVSLRPPWRLPGWRQPRHCAHGSQHYPIFATNADAMFIQFSRSCGVWPSRPAAVSMARRETWNLEQILQ